MLSSKFEGNENEENRVFASDATVNDGRHLESLEARYVQNAAFNEFPQSLFVLSRYTCGSGQICLGHSDRRRMDLTVVTEPGVWKVRQFHENAHFVGQSGHDPNCAKFAGPRRFLDKETADSDTFNFELARALTSSGLIKIDYECANECFFHGNAPIDESQFLKHPSWCDQVLTHDELLDHILQDVDGVGFVCLRGGRETVVDDAGSISGMCLQRGPVTPQEIGPAALELELRRVKLKRGKKETEEVFNERKRASAEKSLARKCRRDFTLLRKGFIGDVSIPVDQFRFLYEKRGLRGFELLHYARWEGRTWLKPLIDKVLQRRHELGLMGLKDSLEAMSLKIWLNRCVSTK